MAKCPAWREGNQGFEPFSYDRCYATKEMETCECLGNEAFCDFYPEKRKAATKPKYGEWISVKDRLPEVGKVVLAYTCYQTFEFVKLTRRERTTFITTRGPDWWDGMDILYWMPLPEPPKEG